MNENDKSRETIDRLPPYNLEAEQAVLGTVLQASIYDQDKVKECMDLCIEKFGPSGGKGWFYDIRNQKIWEVYALLYRDGKPIDMSMLHFGLKHFDNLEKVGGHAYLSTVEAQCSTHGMLESYLEILHDEFLARRTLQIATEAIASVYGRNNDLTVKGVVAKFEQGVLELTAEHAGRAEQSATDGAIMMEEKLETIKRGQGMATGISTGYSYLDKMITGLHETEMIVLAGRPSTGKTQLAMNIARNVAWAGDEESEGNGVGVFSLEMNDVGMWSRMLFQMSGADYQQFRTGGFTKNDELPALMEGLENMKKCKLWIDHTAGLTIGELRARARRMAREHEIKVWIIDYFGLIRADFRRKDRREELGEISMGIKSMAKELNAPVIILAQLNRESAKENRVPTMEDLRDCGQLEQDADIVGILHQPKLRSEPYDGVGTAERDLFEPGIGKWNERQKRINVQIAKQRNGPVGAVELVSLTRSMSFIEHDRDTCRHAKKEAWE